MANPLIWFHPISYVNAKPHFFSICFVCALFLSVSLFLFLCLSFSLYINIYIIYIYIYTYTHTYIYIYFIYIYICNIYNIYNIYTHIIYIYIYIYIYIHISWRQKKITQFYVTFRFTAFCNNNFSKYNMNFQKLLELNNEKCLQQAVKNTNSWSTL